ncbi:DUF4153 domain-containing protein [Peptoniphilus mikwangii]|uniref:DUF4153 domain-containing protein n=1 Tax=Peptoniphilus mikwangii TaxID=1354300 RepID=UPI000409B617|nr:DUF4153 domain-containing protein [Peptoniphilus mikwangii]
MKVIYKFKDTINKSFYSIKRFPIAMLCILLSALFFIIGVNKGSFPTGADNVGLDLTYTKIGYFLLMSSATFIFLKLFSESLSANVRNEEELKRFRLFKIFAYVINFPFLYGIYERVLFSDNGLFLYEIGYTYFGLLLFFVVSCAYISKLFYHKDYIAYALKIISSGIISVFYSLVLFFGMSVIYYSFKHLFGISISLEVYFNTAILIFLPFNCGIFLSGLPRCRDSFDNYEISKPIKILLAYILIPIFTVYAIIIYLYFAKIIFIREIPSGIVTNLVLWFSILTTILLFILGKIRDIFFVNCFRKVFPIAMIPLLGMMFYSIGIRVYQYGVTENRYFVIVGGIFCLISMLYYIFYNKNSNITIPVVLSALILLSSVGPVSAYNVTASNQNARLNKLLYENNMLKGDKIIPNSNVEEDAKEEIIEIVKYMSNNHRTWELKYIPNDFTFDNENIEKVFGFKLDNIEQAIENDEIFYYEPNSTSINIEGYTKLMQFEFYSSEPNTSSIGSYEATLDNGKVTIRYINKDNKFDLTTFNVKDVFEKLKAIKKSNEIVDPEDLSIEGREQGINYKIIFVDLSLTGIQQKDSYYYLKFYLMAGKAN